MTVVCIGETMAMLVPESGRPLELATYLELSNGGAESNVALCLAEMGLEAHWVSRVGSDGLGTRILSELEGHGVDVSGVRTDPARPTGIYVKVPQTDTAPASVLYYRRGSAASAMGPQMLEEPIVQDLIARAALIHVSGITAALSGECLALLEALLTRPRPTAKVSFDVNWRPSLWAERDTGPLLHLANLADIVLVGQDEAAEAFGAEDEAEIRRLLPDPAIVVVKHGAVSAAALRRYGDRSEVPALKVDVIEPVGAGDSFAAGFLSGFLHGSDDVTSLRRGHIAAACALTVTRDRGSLPPKDVFQRVLNCSEEEWAATTVSSSGFALGV